MYRLSFNLIRVQVVPDFGLGDDPSNESRGHEMNRQLLEHNLKVNMLKVVYYNRISQSSYQMMHRLWMCVCLSFRAWRYQLINKHRLWMCVYLSFRAWKYQLINKHRLWMCVYLSFRAWKYQLIKTEPPAKRWKRKRRCFIIASLKVFF